MATATSCASNFAVNLRKRKGEEDLQNQGNVKHHHISSDACPSRWNTPLVELLISVFHEYVDGEVKAGRLRNIIFEEHEWENVDGQVEAEMIHEQDEWEKLHRTFIDRAIAANIPFGTKDPVTASEMRHKILAMIRNSSCELEDIKVGDMELWQKWETCCARTKWATLSSGGSARTMSTGRALTRTCVPDKWSDEYRNLLKKLIEIIELMNLSSEIHDAFADVMLSTGGAAMQLFVNMKESMRLEYVKMQIAYSC